MDVQNVNRGNVLNVQHQDEQCGDYMTDVKIVKQNDDHHVYNVILQLHWNVYFVKLVIFQLIIYATLFLEMKQLQLKKIVMMQIQYMEKDVISANLVVQIPVYYVSKVIVMNIKINTYFYYKQLKLYYDINCIHINIYQLLFRWSRFYQIFQFQKEFTNNSNNSMDNFISENKLQNQDLVKNCFFNQITYSNI
ncbi:unnamed protein product [Paramecium sonneborni]|uniref:Transmembrane protein n=1 Tax=Paramecium sonneborni TaxID=65129 RepID=A0A8S1MT25_9CILI|nr:unnamed protein product [Paramecium sonneborni]